MNKDELMKLLEEYDISNIQDLKDNLKYVKNLAKNSIPTEEIKKPCTNGIDFDITGVPDCRKLRLIYDKMYAKKYKSEEFYKKVAEKVNLGYESIKKYFLCAQCDKNYKTQFKRFDEDKDENKESIKCTKISKKDFLKQICFDLEIKLNYQELFEKKYNHTLDFRSVIKEELSNDYKGITKDKALALNKNEQKKLFNMVYVSKKELETNLILDSESKEGSDKYKINLALYALDRDLVEQSRVLLNSLKSTQFENNITYLQLRAKVFSKVEEDEEAILTLNKLIKIQIDTETYSLLAASIKRDAINNYFDDYGELEQRLEEARTNYELVFNINKDYYPAINIIYLQMMLTYTKGGQPNDVKDSIKSVKNIWRRSNIKSKLETNDWWSFISNIEYLILIEEYNKANEELEKHIQNLNEEEISDFSISSTIRQLQNYNKITDINKLEDFIKYLKKFQENKKSLKYKPKYLEGNIHDE